MLLRGHICTTNPMLCRRFQPGLPCTTGRAEQAIAIRLSAPDLSPVGFELVEKHMLHDGDDQIIALDHTSVDGMVFNAPRCHDRYANLRFGPAPHTPAQRDVHGEILSDPPPQIVSQETLQIDPRRVHQNGRQQVKGSGRGPRISAASRKAVIQGRSISCPACGCQCESRSKRSFPKDAAGSRPDPPSSRRLNDRRRRSGRKKA